MDGIGIFLTVHIDIKCIFLGGGYRFWGARLYFFLKFASNTDMFLINHNLVKKCNYEKSSKLMFLSRHIWTNTIYFDVGCTLLYLAGIITRL